MTKHLHFLHLADIFIQYDLNDSYSVQSRAQQHQHDRGGGLNQRPSDCWSSVLTTVLLFPNFE